MHDSEARQLPNIIVAINKANNHQNNKIKRNEEVFTLTHSYRLHTLSEQLQENKTSQPGQEKKGIQPKYIFNALVHDVLWILLIGIFVSLYIGHEMVYEL